MGLDMYLNKKTYVKNWDFQKDNEKHSITVKKGGKKHSAIKPERIANIEEEILYWRKANHIHQWFVDNVQHGKDDCEEYFVGRDQLKELVSTISKVLEDNTKAEELLPTQSGFFFGGTEYDEYYFNELRRTKEALEGELKTESGDFYYQSSW